MKTTVRKNETWWERKLPARKRIILKCLVATLALCPVAAYIVAKYFPARVDGIVFASLVVVIGIAALSRSSVIGCALIGLVVWEFYLSPPAVNASRPEYSDFILPAACVAVGAIVGEIRRRTL